MERQSVSSSNLHSVGYDQESAVLEIKFKEGGVYQYSGNRKPGLRNRLHG